MNNLFGGSIQTLDSKGRINLPAKIRDLAEKEQNGEQLFVVTRGSDPNIAIFPMSEWKKINLRIDELVPNGKERRLVRRRMNMYSSIQKLDKQGRLNIPAELIKYADLDKDVLVIATGEKVEVWNPEKLDGDVHKIENTYQKVADVLDF